MDRQKTPNSLPSRDGGEDKQEGSSWRAKYFTEIRSLLPFSSNRNKTEISKKRKLYRYAAIAMVVLAILGIGLGVGLSALAAKNNHRDHDNIVQLGYASYRGYKQDNGVSYWKGMRYAAPPTGSLRFAAPQDPQIQSDVQDATEVCNFDSSQVLVLVILTVTSMVTCVFRRVFIPSPAISLKIVCM